MWFLCLSYCLMPPRWTGMSRADTVTLASEGSSAEMRHRKEPPQKGPTPPSHSASSGAGWGSSAHPHGSLAPSNRYSPASSGVPLATEMEAFLMNYQSSSPDAVLDATISGCTDHNKLPQRADQLLSVSVSSSESYWCQGSIRNILWGESPTKASPR